MTERELQIKAQNFIIKQAREIESKLGQSIYVGNLHPNLNKEIQETLVYVYKEAYREGQRYLKEIDELKKQL